MNLDVNSRFSYNPGVKFPRSRFDLGHTVKTSFDIGQLIPFYVEEVLPGDTHQIETNILARMQTLLTPIMDEVFLDVFYFFVPNRLCWDHWKEFMGENTQSAWYPETEYVLPQIQLKPNSSIVAKSVADYMGIPIVTTPDAGIFEFNALPFRAYGLIWNEWFRDENLQDPVLVDTGDSNHDYDPTDPVDGGTVLMANKYHDYFTSSLPSPQKGPDVSINMAGGDVPVVTRPKQHTNGGDLDPSYDKVGLQFTRAVGEPLNDNYNLALRFVNSDLSTPGLTYGGSCGDLAV